MTKDFEQVHEHWEGNNVRFSAERMELTAKRLRKTEAEALGKWVVFAGDVHQIVGIVANVGLMEQMILTDCSIPVQYSPRRWPLYSSEDEAIVAYLK